ncbi:hypothetical protein C8J57DRAFT_1464196 [Mycena rebaudengoi]|nr:hypothetical protein C8J57DRAFT_1464196 [Mycena rebaudengoi]
MSVSINQSDNQSFSESAADIKGSIGDEDGMEFGSSTVNMSLVLTLDSGPGSEKLPLHSGCVAAESAADIEGSIGYEDGMEFGSSTVNMSLVRTLEAAFVRVKFGAYIRWKWTTLETAAALPQRHAAALQRQNPFAPGNGGPDCDVTALKKKARTRLADPEETGGNPDKNHITAPRAPPRAVGFVADTCCWLACRHPPCPPRRPPDNKPTDTRTRTHTAPSAPRPAPRSVCAVGAAVCVGAGVAIAEQMQTETIQTQTAAAMRTRYRTTTPARSRTTTRTRGCPCVLHTGVGGRQGRLARRRPRALDSHSRWAAVSRCSRSHFPHCSPSASSSSSSSPSQSPPAAGSSSPPFRAPPAAPAPATIPLPHTHRPARHTLRLLQPKSPDPRAERLVCLAGTQPTRRCRCFEGEGAGERGERKSEKGGREGRPSGGTTEHGWRTGEGSAGESAGRTWGERRAGKGARESKEGKGGRTKVGRCASWDRTNDNGRREGSAVNTTGGDDGPQRKRERRTEGGKKCGGDTGRKDAEWGGGVEETAGQVRQEQGGAGRPSPPRPLAADSAAFARAPL